MTTVLAALAFGTAAHSASFLSRSGTIAIAASCPAAPLTGECPNVPGSQPLIPIGSYPLVQDWKLYQPGLTLTSYIGSASTGYGGAIGNIYPDGLTPALQVGAFTIPDARGQYAVSYGLAAAAYAYTYTGTSAVALPLVGNINFDVLFAAPTTLALNYSFGSATMRMAVTTPNLFANPGTAPDSVVCGNPDVLAAGYATGGVGGFANGFAAKSFNFALDLTNGCDGQPMMLNPGQSVYIYTYLNAYAQRGATVDATHSFHVNLAPGTPPAVAAALQSGLTLHANVPEPASWAMMIAGFGLVGSAARRRRMASLA
ncbi:PEPxxWA-CTERM sorting domain-containing protein [Polymorphobacter arshaanensis]|uniref:PEPxxWA-CTERM sorting domain-containing protein n=1 Tax=Glacieibacterium arshaanense TaxID=2511025 RepID=UPI003C77A155